MDPFAWRIARCVYPILVTAAGTGVCLNSLLLIATIRSSSLRSTANILIGCCALFDVVHQMGYFVLFPILFSDYYMDSFVCSCIQFLPELGMAAGAFCVFSLGVDRMLSVVISLAYKELRSNHYIKIQLLPILMFCGWCAYLMISYWTPKNVLCGMPSPFHGDALGLWSSSIAILNISSICLYFVTWQTLKKRSISMNSKKAFASIATVMLFEITGWLVSSSLIYLSKIIAVPEHRPPFHYVACLFVNIGIAFKALVYYSMSAEYRHAIRSLLGLKRTTSDLTSNINVSTEIITTF